MNRLLFHRTTISLLTLIALPGCTKFGSRGQSALASLSGVVQLGLVKNSTVKAYCLSENGQRQADPLGIATSDNNGKFNIALANHSSCSILLVASGGQYEEESTGASVQLGASDEIRSIIENKHASGSSAEVSITPVSDLVVARYESLRTSLQSVGGTTSNHEELDQVIGRAKEEIRQSVGLPQGTDVTRLLPSPPNRPDGEADSKKNQLAVVIAGISQLAASRGVGSHALMADLATDAADGSISADYWLDLPNKVDEWVAGARNPGGFSAPPVFNPVTTPSIDVAQYPMPNSDQLRTVPFRVVLDGIEAEASGNCAGPFKVKLLNMENELTPASAGLKLQAQASSGTASLQVHPSSISCEAGTGAITEPAQDLTSFYVRFTATRPNKINLVVNAVASSVAPGNLSYLVPVIPPATPVEIHMISVYEPANASTGWSTDSAGNSVPPSHWDVPVTVTIDPGSDPIILVLASYEGAIWNIQGAASRVQKVIAHGYYTPTINGVNPTNVQIYSYESGTGVFYAQYASNWIYDASTLDYKLFAVKSQELAGGQVRSMQGAYSKNNFVVADGMNLAPPFPAQVSNPPWIYARAMGGYDAVTFYESAGTNYTMVDVLASSKDHSGIYVNVTLEHVTASEADIPAFVKSVYIPPGANKASFQFSFNKDLVAEGGSETFKLKFSLPSGSPALIVMPEMIGTIRD